jgi:hypothetical protein
MHCVRAKVLQPPIHLSQLADYIHIIATFACHHDKDTLDDMSGKSSKWVGLFRKQTLHVQCNLYSASTRTNLHYNVQTRTHHVSVAPGFKILGSEVQNWNSSAGLALRRVRLDKEKMLCFWKLCAVQFTTHQKRRLLCCTRPSDRLSDPVGNDLPLLCIDLLYFYL